MAEITEHIRSISVEDWHALAMDGNDISITIRLNGDSMGPLIRKNKDEVTILPLRRAVRAGDIVLFADGAGRYVVHRVWKRREDRGRHAGRPLQKAGSPAAMPADMGAGHAGHTRQPEHFGG